MPQAERSPRTRADAAQLAEASLVSCDGMQRAADEARAGVRADDRGKFGDEKLAESQLVAEERRQRFGLVRFVGVYDGDARGLAVHVAGGQRGDAAHGPGVRARTFDHAYAPIGQTQQRA